MRLYSVPFSYSDTKEYTCLLKDEVNRSSANDCVINTLYFMKMLKKGDAEMYSRAIHNDKMTGLQQQQIIDLVFINLTAISKTQDAIIKTKELSFQKLKELMEPNTCTFVGFNSKDINKVGHAVVVFKNNNGELGIYDGQIQRLVNTEEEMKNWFELYNTENLIVLYETNKRVRLSGRKDEKQTLKRIRIKSLDKSKSKTFKTKSKTQKIKNIDLDLDEKRQFRIFQKIMNNKEKRERLLDLYRLDI